MSEHHGDNINQNIKGDNNKVTVNKIHNHHAPPEKLKPIRYIPHSPPSIFVGREDKLNELKTALKREDDITLVIEGVHGMGGIGKTTLALRLADDLYKDKTFGSVLWADINQQPDPLGILLHQWGTFVGLQYQNGQTPEMVAGELKSLLEERNGNVRTLAVFDNVWGKAGVAAVRILAAALPSNSTILLTTRSSSLLPDLDAIKHVLDRLTPEESVQLLHDLWKRGCQPQELENLVADPKILDELAHLMGGHPLALTLAARRVLKAGNRLKALTTHVEQYRKGIPVGDFKGLRLAEGETPHENLELVLSYSYNELSDDDKRRFRAMGVLAPDQPFELGALIFLWQIEDDEAEEYANALWGWGLLDSEPELTQAYSESSLTWYSQHLLLRGYASALLSQISDQTTCYFTDLYTLYALERAKYLNSLKPEDWNRITPFLPHIHYIGDWLTNQLKLTKPEDALSWRLGLGFANQTCRYVGHRTEIHKREWLEMGLNAARYLKDQQFEGLFLNGLGAYCSERGEPAQALEYFQQAQVLKKKADDKFGLGVNLNNIGTVFLGTGNPTRALEYFQQALVLFAELNEKKGIATTLDNIGAVHANFKNWNKALEYFQQALPMREQFGNKSEIANTLNNIGTVYLELKNYVKALQCLERARLLHEETNNKSGLASNLSNIGEVYRNIGNLGLALEYFQQALSLREQTGDKYGLATTLNSTGLIYRELNNYTKSFECYQQALILTRETKDSWLEAVVLGNIAVSYADQEQLTLAFSSMTQAAGLMKQIGHPHAQICSSILQWWQPELAFQQSKKSDNSVIPPSKLRFLKNLRFV